MILFPILTLLSGFFISLAIHHLNQSLSNYYDFVALTMVLGGTFSVGVVLIPWEYRTDLVRSIKALFKPEKRRYKQIVTECLNLLRLEKLPGTEGKKEDLYLRVLSEGLELVQLGFSAEKIDRILGEKVFQSVKRVRKIGAAVKGLAKYPPAFGLMGTVLGLVNIMKHLAAATDASKLGVEMSVALVATMYGLLVANFFVQPIGELLMKKADEEEEYAEIALQAVLLFKERASLVEAHEILSAMVPDEQSLDFNEIISLEEAA
jgi:chemotaxis protein MotA